MQTWLGNLHFQKTKLRYSLFAGNVTHREKKRRRKDHTPLYSRVNTNWRIGSATFAQYKIQAKYRKRYLLSKRLKSTRVIFLSNFISSWWENDSRRHISDRLLLARKNGGEVVYMIQKYFTYLITKYSSADYPVI